MIAAALPETAFALTFSGEAAAPHSAGFELVEHMVRRGYIVELYAGAHYDLTWPRTVQLVGVVYDEAYGPVIEYRTWDEDEGKAHGNKWRVRWVDIARMHVW